MLRFILEIPKLLTINDLRTGAPPPAKSLTINNLRTGENHNAPVAPFEHKRTTWWECNQKNIY
jgi:hypothetical protein